MKIDKDYTVKPLDFDNHSLQTYSSFLSDYYKLPGLFTFDYLKWQYADNPVGKAVGYNAFYKDELIAHVCTIPLRALMFGREEKWLLLVNAMTVPAHRRKGISVGLAEQVEKLGLERGCTFMIGIANRNSTPSYLKSGGMEWSTTLDARVGLGMPKRKKPVGEDFDFKVLWDKESLDWRLKRPGTAYWKKESGGSCRIFCPAGKPGIKTLLGSYDPGEIGEDVPAKSSVSKPLTLWIGKDPDVRWGAPRAFNLPDWIRPSPLNFLYKDLSGKNRSLKDKRIFFQALDFDAF